MPTVSISVGPTEAQGGGFDRAMSWVFEREGGFQNHPNDPGNYWSGNLIGTKYGISANSWAWKYDIPNLTKEQAREIYYEYYWEPSGAKDLPWPLSLVVFDTAVLHGTSVAKEWLDEVGPNPWRFAAKRLRSYTSSDNWEHFGAGWVNRVILLIEEIG